MSVGNVRRFVKTFHEIIRETAGHSNERAGFFCSIPKQRIFLCIPCKGDEMKTVAANAATPFKMDFDDFILHTITFEGGYVNDPVDPGGETNYGISKRAYPTEDIASLTIEDAIGIYRQDYWEKPRIADLSETISFAVFDTAVNMGPRKAIKLLQKSLRIKEDGMIGPVTIEASKKADVKKYTTLRLEEYQRIVRSNPRMQKFYYGWAMRSRRVESIQLEANKSQKLH